VVTTRSVRRSLVIICCFIEALSSCRKSQKTRTGDAEWGVRGWGAGTTAPSVPMLNLIDGDQFLWR
jgi:hypothetical protein